MCPFSPPGSSRDRAFCFSFWMYLCVCVYVRLFVIYFVMIILYKWIAYTSIRRIHQQQQTPDADALSIGIVERVRACVLCGDATRTHARTVHRSGTGSTRAPNIRVPPGRYRQSDGGICGLVYSNGLHHCGSIDGRRHNVCLFVVVVCCTGGGSSLTCALTHISL